MGKRGNGYGSEDHLHNYLDHRRGDLSAAVLEAIREPASTIEWIPFRRSPVGEKREWEGLRFIPDGAVQDEWRKFWPSRGRPQNWDAVGTLRGGTTNEWVLVEAKANEAELRSPPTAAMGGRAQIEAAMTKAKGHLGVHSDAPWLGPYYQYASRLATLYFLNVEVRVPTRLVFLYFVGDKFPDGRYCPANVAGWRPLIEACHRTLGLPEHHPLSDRVHEVFLPAFAGSTAA